VNRRIFLRGALLLACTLGSAALLISQGFQLPEIPENVLKSETILRAMRDEMDRSRQLGVVGAQDPLYFISYTLSDSDSLHVSSSMGATVNVQRNQFRSPNVEVRVGSYQADNTGHVNSGAYSGSRYDGTWPLDDNYENLRDGFWLTTDRAFKTALESMSRKRAALNNSAAPPDQLPDFTKAPPVVSLPKIPRREINQQSWTTRANRLSAVFRSYPEILSSGVELQVIEGTTYLMNTEGTAIRYDDGLAWVFGKAEGQAADGMVVHDAASVQALEAEQFPNDEELRKEFTAMAENVKALAKAPAGEHGRSSSRIP
jgi:TldD protein